MAVKIIGAAALSLWPVMLAAAQPATGPHHQMLQAAYFSDECRREAEALGVVETSNAGTLVAAFSHLRQHLAAQSGDWPRLEQNECRHPVVLLINLLRRNGIDGELVFVGPTTPDDESGGIERVLVYVPALRRYVDAASSGGGPGDIERLIPAGAARIHIQGPSAAGDARAGCRNTCMQVYGSRDLPASRVKTEAVPSP
jgi:hypothetical protein